MLSFSLVITLVILVTLYSTTFANVNKDDLQAKLTTALSTSKAAVASIAKEWQIEKYPYFLKSCFMHKSSWEVMKWKYMVKILKTAINKKSEKFVISFTGSSVTAGHDSHFNQSTPIVTQTLMEKALHSADVTLDVRNVALGNNPCMPYDICVKFFTGYDADVVHWEQSYFCDGKPVMEQFIRQAMTIPTRPIVVFSESNTGHWGNDQCPKTDHTRLPEEDLLLKAKPMQLVSELNKEELHRSYPSIGHINKHYHGAAIQTFTHHKHTEYACQGPYIKDWMLGAASWHPSVIAHRLRASHHAYFWLEIWVEAIGDILSHLEHRAAEAILKDVEHHLENNYAPMSEAAHKMDFLDGMHCLTDYEPRAVREVSLKDHVVAGLAKDDKAKEGWLSIIYEDMVDPNLVLRSKEHGYQDFKWLLHGKDNAGPLSIKVKNERAGPMYVCETPGIWGALPKGFTHLFEDSIECYLEKDVKDPKNYKFEASKAVKLSHYHDKDLDICIQLRIGDKKDKEFPEGEHVLTIVPKPNKKLIVAWVLSP